MKKERSLNTDIPGSIAELQAAMKEFLLKYKLYKLLLRGKGLEFEAYRNYAPDDDAGSIDWKASMRANNLLVKQYRDERNLKIVFVIDVSENMIFGSTEKLKCEFAAEIVSAFSHLIITAGDRVGYAFVAHGVKNYVKPSGGTQHFHRLIDFLTNPYTYGGPQHLEVMFNFVLNTLGKNIESVVLVSDFVTFQEAHQKSLALISGKYETLALMVRDPLDNTMPNIAGEIIVEDPKTGQQILINPSFVRDRYEKISLEQEKVIRQSCIKNRIDLLQLMTNEPFVPSLSEFLKGRVKQKELR